MDGGTCYFCCNMALWFTCICLFKIFQNDPICTFCVCVCRIFKLGTICNFNCFQRHLCRSREGIQKRLKEKWFSQKIFLSRSIFYSEFSLSIKNKSVSPYFYLLCLSLKQKIILRKKVWFQKRLHKYQSGRGERRFHRDFTACPGGCLGTGVMG